MPCGSCAKRREMIKDAFRKEGVKGAIKILPRVGQHAIVTVSRKGKDREQQNHLSNRT